jgi:four helix bundle protein
MPFAHERLAVYQSSLDFLALSTDVIEHLPRGRSHIADQLSRAATSITLNIAEGAGKFSRADKRRYYLTALGSTTECAAIFDVCLRLKVISAERHREGKRMVDQLAAMVTGLAKSMEGKGKEAERGEGEGEEGEGEGSGKGA